MRIGQLLLGLIVAVALGLAQTPKSPTLSWTRMIWHSASVGGRSVEHAALMVEIQLDGMDTPAIMQLDLGSDATMVYGVPYTQLRRNDTAVGRNLVSLSGVLANCRFQGERFHVRADFGDPITPGKPISLGTVGLDFFTQRILVLDFVRQRLAVLNKGVDLPPAVQHQIDVTPIETRNGKMFVAVTLNGREERGLFYDTGSSLFSLMTTRNRWRELTGRRPDDPANDIWTIKSWGKDAPLIGAPMKGELCVARACISDPLVYFESSGLEGLDFDRYPYKTSGLFGNVPFDGRYTVVVDVPHGRFGLVAGSIADPAAK